MFLDSSIGKEVLADILNSCNYGKILDPDNAVMTSEHNVGTMILQRCGIFHGDVLEFVRKISGIVPPDKPEQEDLLNKGL